MSMIRAAIIRASLCAGQDGAEAGLKQVYADVAEVLNVVATSEDEDEEQPSPASAPNRFAAAVQASLSTGLQPASRCHPSLPSPKAAYDTEVCGLLTNPFAADVLVWRGRSKQRMHVCAVATSWRRPRVQNHWCAMRPPACSGAM
jgi:hypothetical protein